MYVLFCTCKDLTSEPIIALYVYNINVPRVYYVFLLFFFFCLEKIYAIELAQLRY